MKYDRFEDLPVWQTAMSLACGVYAATRDRFFAQPGDARDQLRRAALSVSNNIAEGFERGSTNELLMFLYIARGSAGEVRSMLHFMERLIADEEIKSENLKSEISNSKSEIARLKSLAESCSRQIRGWADSLQNSDIRGQRHLNDATRREANAKNRADAFRKQLDETLRDVHPSIYGQPTVK
ncbi:MAG: four helix bundle protein [Pirellulales bacterium]